MEPEPIKRYKLKREFIFVHKDCSYTILPEGFYVQEVHGGLVGMTSGKRLLKESYYVFGTMRDENNYAVQSIFDDQGRNKWVAGRFDKKVVENNPDLFELIK